MFVVPLYAFLTTTVPKTETARTVAANNIVNSGAMVIGSLLAFALSSLGRRPGRPAAAGRGDVPGVGVARMEAPPRLRLRPRLAEQDRNEQEAGDEGRREQLEVRAMIGAVGARPVRRQTRTVRGRTGAGRMQRLGGRAAWQILNAIFTMFTTRANGNAAPPVPRRDGRPISQS